MKRLVRKTNLEYCETNVTPKEMFLTNVLELSFYELRKTPI